jgi:hypothetical protein
MELNVLKEQLMNKDDKNRHFALLIIDISKHGAKGMGHVLLSDRIVEMLYHSIKNGGCGFLLLWFLFVRNLFWNKTGSSCCNIIHETGSCHFDK